MTIVFKLLYVYRYCLSSSPDKSCQFPRNRCYSYTSLFIISDKIYNAKSSASYSLINKTTPLSDWPFCYYLSSFDLSLTTPLHISPGLRPKRYLRCLLPALMPHQISLGLKVKICDMYANRSKPRFLRSMTVLYMS